MVWMSAADVYTLTLDCVDGVLRGPEDARGSAQLTCGAAHGQIRRVHGRQFGQHPRASGGARIALGCIGEQGARCEADDVGGEVG